jgi:hypothetical protein
VFKPVVVPFVLLASFGASPVFAQPDQTDTVPTPLRAARGKIFDIFSNNVADHLKTYFFELWPDKGPLASSAPKARIVCQSSWFRSIVMRCRSDLRMIM